MHVILTDDSSEHPRDHPHVPHQPADTHTNNTQRFKHLLRIETLLKTYNVKAYSARLSWSTSILIYRLADTQSEVQMTLQPTAASTFSFLTERTSIQYLEDFDVSERQRQEIAQDCTAWSNTACTPHQIWLDYQNKDKTGGAWSMHGNKQDCILCLGGRKKLNEKWYVKRSSHGSGNAIRTNRDGSTWNGFVCFELGTVAISCTHCNKPADCTKYGNSHE